MQEIDAVHPQKEKRNDLYIPFDLQQYSEYT
jgi:hypothetical protein